MRAVSYPQEQVLQPSRFEHDAQVRAQVCVIGTGAGGAVAAWELASRGLDVALLEEGYYHTAEDYANETPMRSVRRLYRDGGLTFTLGTPSVLMPLGKCVGGTTVINSGTALRMPESAWARWKRDHALPVLEWADVVRLYERVEPIVGVAPSPEPVLAENTRVFREGSQKLGYEGEVVPRNAVGCQASGRCFIGCPENAKQSTNVSFVPRALDLGARLYVGCRAEKVLVESGRVRGIEASLDPLDGGRRRRLVVRADRVVVAAGAVLSPVLLARSGLDTGHPHFGQNLRIHPASRVVGLFDHEVRGQFDVPQSYHLTHFLDRGVSVEGIFIPPAILAPAMPGFGAAHLAEMRRYPNMAMIGYRVIDEARGSVRRSVMGMPVVRYDVALQDARKLLHAMSIAAEVMFTQGARKVWIPVYGRELLTSIEQARALAYGEAAGADIEISAYHPHGTLRMGGDAGSSLTDIEGRYRGVEGLYVADASLFPDSPIVNPMMTIMALASHVGQRMKA